MKAQKTTRSLKLDSICVLTSLILTGLLVIPSMSPAAGDQWEPKTDIPTPRFGLCASAVNGKIYAIGGTPDGGQRFPNVEEYDPTTDRWTKKADMLTPRMYLSSAAVNGKIYAIGGYSSMRTVEEYDPATDTWTRKANMPTGRHWLATCVVDGKIYAIGGSGGKNTVEVYDPATDKWTKKANMPTARQSLTTDVVNGKIYAIGGLPTTWAVGLSTVEEYDPATDKWTKKADMPTARGALAARVVNGKIYAIGGFADSVRTKACLSAVEEYDPVTDTWTKRTDMSDLRYLLSSGVVDNRIYVIGGSSTLWPNINLVSTVEEYTPEGWPFAAVSPQGKLAATWGDVKRGR